MAKRKKRQADDSAARTLDELERESDRLAEWIDQNQTLLLVVAGGLLVIAAIVGFSLSGREAAREAASTELSDLQAEYRTAMGASPGAFEIAEPANPETARTVRSEYVDRFGELADENQGNAVGAVAALEQSQIQNALGDRAAALETLEGALAEMGRRDPARVLLQTRRASLLEADGRWADAATAWESAADLEGPLAAEWLASAARCWAEAGQDDKALAAWSKLQATDSTVQIPPYVQALMEELESGA